MCRKLSIFFLVLLLASASAWAFPGRATGSQDTKHIVISAPAVPEDELKTDSGTTPESTLTESQESLVEPEILEKAAEGKRLSSDELIALSTELSAVRANLEALEKVSEEKDSTIDALAKENGKLKEETGTKAYLLIDGILGFSEGVPDYGLGFTLGTRIGNSLMLELGADYMLGSNLLDVLDYSMDNWTFRAGIGWLF